MANILDSILSLGRKPKAKAIENRSYTPSPWIGQSIAGVTVTAESAMSFAAYFAALRLISTDVAALPRLPYRRLPLGGKEPDHSHPLANVLDVEANPEVDSFNFARTLVAHRLGHGNGYAEIVTDRETGDVKALWNIHPTDITPARNNAGLLVYKLRNGRLLKPSEVIHIKGLSDNGLVGYSVLQNAQHTIELGLSSEIYGASFYANNAQASGYLVSKKPLKKEAGNKALEDHNAEHQGPSNAFKVGKLVGEWEWLNTSITPQDATYLETRQFTNVDICRWFGISPYKLADYSNGSPDMDAIEREYATNVLAPMAMELEREFNRKLLPYWERSQWTIKHNMSSRQRGNPATRVAYYKGMFDLGTMTQNQILESEDLPSVLGGNRRYLMANNYAPIDDEGNLSLPVDPNVSSPATTDQTSPALPAPEAVSEVQDTALNGAQIESFLAVISAVGAGQLPAESAKGIIEASFPSVAESVVEKILAPMASFKPATSPDEKTPSVPSEATEAVRQVLVGEVGRIVRKECLAIRRAIRKDDAAKLVTDFYGKQADQVREALAPALLAYQAVTGKTQDLDHLVKQLTDESRDTVLNLDSPEAIEQVINHWENTKANALIKGDSWK